VTTSELHALKADAQVTVLVPSAPNENPLWRLAKFIGTIFVPSEVSLKDDTQGRNAMEVAVIELHDGSRWLATSMQLRHGSAT
jgi:hypothetical protein